MQTTKSLLDEGHDVTVLAECLGYVNRQGHLKALEQMEKLGAKIK